MSASSRDRFREVTDAFPPQLELHAGGSWSQTLPTAAGGYRWQAESSDPGVATAEVGFDRGGEDGVGTYTTGQSLRITGHRGGSAEIVLTQLRPWQPASEPIACHRIAVTVPVPQEERRRDER